MGEDPKYSYSFEIKNKNGGYGRVSGGHYLKTTEEAKQLLLNTYLNKK
jgi:hypothetical protein